MDAQLPPALAPWLREKYNVQAFSLRELGLRDEVDWVTCGNVSNANLKAIFAAVFNRALDLLAAGEAIVEIGHPGA